MPKKAFWAGLLAAVLLAGSACAQSVSPTTGLTLDGEPTVPVIAVISHTFGETKADGKTVQAAGVGKRQAWGAQQADIIYESILYQEGSSRFAYLYHDALVRGEAVSAGPLRSVRDVHIDLSRMWNAGLIFSAGTDSSTPALPEVWARSFSRSKENSKPYIETVKGRKAPDCFSADVSGMHAQLADQTWTASGFAFTDDAPDEALKNGTALHLQWGKESKQTWTTHLTYDAERNQYLCYSGKAPLKNWHDSTCTQESQLAFDNVIVQYAAHSYPVSQMLPELDLTSGGKAVILRGGKRMEAYWICQNGQTQWVDETGAVLPLSRGKTYIAFWDEGIGSLTLE